MKRFVFSVVACCFFGFLCGNAALAEEEIGVVQAQFLRDVENDDGESFFSFGSYVHSDKNLAQEHQFPNDNFVAQGMHTGYQSLACLIMKKLLGGQTVYWMDNTRILLQKNMGVVLQEGVGSGYPAEVLDSFSPLEPVKACS